MTTRSRCCNKVSEDIEHLGLELARLAGTAEFIQTGIKFVVPKDVDHECPLRSAVRCARLLSAQE